MLIRLTPVLRRWLLAGVCLLQLLGLATPLLAVGAAARQGVEVEQVCPLHGVPMSMMGTGRADRGQEPPAQGDEFPASPQGSPGSACPLAMLSLAAPLTPWAATALPGLPVTTEPVLGPVDPAPRLDASRRWSLRRKHGPPAIEVC